MSTEATLSNKWRIGSIVALLVGALVSLAVLGYSGGDESSAFSGVGFWVVAPYLLFCIVVVLGRTPRAQKFVFAAAAALVTFGVLGYVDAIFLSPDAQSALVFGVVPIAQMAAAAACIVVTLLVRFIPSRGSS